MKARWTALGVMALTLGVAQLAPEPVGACRIVTHDTDDRDQGVNASSPSPPVIRSAKWVRQFVEGQGGGCDCEEPYPCGGGDGGDGVIRFLELSYEAEFPRIRLVQGDEVPKYILPDNRTSPFQVVLYHYDLPNNSLPMRLALSTLDEEGNRSLTVTTTITATEDRGFER
jgi:hypothetical protein